jgi:type IV secretory pathway TraG/TraD family ATPase VirD4
MTASLVEWFHTHTGTAGVVLLSVFFVGFIGWIIYQQYQKNGAKALVIYGSGIVALFIFHQISPPPPIETAPPVKKVSDRFEKITALTENKKSNDFLRLEQRLRDKKNVVALSSVEEDTPKDIDWMEEIIIPLTYWVFGICVFLYIFRSHSGIFKLGSIKQIATFNKWIRPSRSKTNELGSGDFASTAQIKNWLTPNDSLDTKLHVTDLRNSSGIVIKKSELAIPSGQRNRHILIIAKTGSGKTTKMILPILYHDCLCPHRSTIIIDSKQEMWSKLSGLVKERNPEKNLFMFNPLDIYRSMSWNILSKVSSDTDCKLIANSVIMATDEPQAKQDSPFFRNSALQVLNAVMVGLMNDPDEEISMPRIHQLFSTGMHSLCDWLEAHPKAIRTSKAFVELARSGSQNADTIMSELSMRLQAWDLNAIRATTWQNEIDIERIIKEPSLFVVELRESELKMLRPLANVIVVELLRYLTKYAEECPGQTLPRPVGLVVDEFASALGRLPDIHIKLNTLRSRNVSIVAAIQSIGQVKGNYGEDWESVLSGFSTKIFMPSLDYTDSEWASKESGIMTVRYRTSSKGTNRKITENFSHNNASTNEQIQQRAVLTPDEIGRPSDRQATFFLPETPVFQGHLTPFYEVPEMLKNITKYSKAENEVKLRESPIEYEEVLPEPIVRSEATPGGAPATNGNGTPLARITPQQRPASSQSDDQIWTALEEIKSQQLDWDNTTGDARKWWEAFEDENKSRIALVLKVGQEIASRNATITDFFLAYVYSNTDNIQATLAYLDYTMHMKQAQA